MFRREIPRDEVHAIAEQITGAPVKGARIVEICIGIHHIAVFTNAQDAEGHYIPDDKGGAARDCHMIRIGGGDAK